MFASKHKTNMAEVRYDKYRKLQTASRKVFSVNEKLKILMCQNYSCPGYYCKGEAKMPPEFDLDHRIPLFEAGVLHHKYSPEELAHLDRLDDGTFDLNSLSNLEALCTRCHRYKTSAERTAFFRLERQARLAKEAARIDFEPACPPAPPTTSPHFKVNPKLESLLKDLERFRYQPPPGL
jgi:5-methylcytosine-specific restriction endonuclease McrA